MTPHWTRDPEHGVVVALPCGHRVTVLERWIGHGGRFLGRLGCTGDGCRRVYDGVALEGWPTCAP